MGVIGLTGNMEPIYETPPEDFVPDFLYGVVYRLSRPPGGNSDGS